MSDAGVPYVLIPFGPNQTMRKLIDDTVSFTSRQRKATSHCSVPIDVNEEILLHFILSPMETEIFDNN